jgi:hypothetical protein
VPLQDLVDHLKTGGDLASFLAVRPELSSPQITDAVVYALAELISREKIEVGPPQASLLPRLNDRGAITNTGELRADQVVGWKALCPACRTLVFQAWPEGWDSHAEHRCSGLLANRPADRKAEFKRRYGHLFR